jgi:hypothetical protein
MVLIFRAQAVQEGLTFKEKSNRLYEKSLTTTKIDCITSQKI